MKPVKPANRSRDASVQKSRNRVVAGICVLLALAVFAVFGRTLRYGFVNLDDDLYVYHNPVVTQGLTVQGVRQVFTRQMCDFYHPLTMLSLMADHQLYGLHAGGYHLTNILLHAATSVLLFLVLLQLMGGRAGKSAGGAATPADALWPCAFVAALFAIHPLRVESVAWVTERKDVLSGLFFVLTIGAYVRYTRVPFSPARYLAVIFLFALGLLSKPSLVTLPFLLLLLDCWPLNRVRSPEFEIRSWAKLFLEKIPLFVLSAAACVAAILTQQPLTEPVGQLPVLPRLGYAAVSYVVYLEKMFYPGQLAALYPFPQKGLPWPEIALALALLAGISIGALALWRRRPYLTVGWLWYLGMLVPMIGLVHVGAVARADRFTYLPQIGVYLMLAWAAKDLTVSWRHGRRIRRAGAFVVIAVLMGCAWKQTSYWRNSESLWTHTLACTSDNAFAHTDFGGALLEAGQIDEAVLHFQEALQINPNDVRTHRNLGDALLQKGQGEEGIQELQRALEINPKDAGSHVDLGIVLYQLGRMDEAVAQYQAALEINPDNTKAHNNLGLALGRLGRTDEAVVQYQKALDTDPGNADAQVNLANVFLQTGRLDKAIAHYEQALAINPKIAEAHNNLGLALYQSGRADEAIGHYQKALEINPGNAGILHNLEAAQKAAQTNPVSIQIVRPP